MNIERIEVGDLVDVFTDYEGYEAVRVDGLVEDVRFASGTPSDEVWPGHEVFTGPGIVGLVDGDRMIFAFSQIATNSKLKYFFPS